jgi:hypothetical protein
MNKDSFCFENSLYILDESPWTVVGLANIFSQSVGLSFPFLIQIRVLLYNPG